MNRRFARPSAVLTLIRLEMSRPGRGRVAADSDFAESLTMTRAWVERQIVKGSRPSRSQAASQCLEVFRKLSGADQWFHPFA